MKVDDVVKVIDHGSNLVRDAPSRVEPPVGVSLQSFLIETGYYIVD